MSDTEYRQLTLADVEPAAHVIANAFVEDPLVSFMLPFKATRGKTMLKFGRIYSELNIKNKRGYGVGEPLQGVAFWKSPKEENLSISVKTLGKLVPLLFTMYPIGYFRAKAILNELDVLHKKYADEPHFYLDNLGVLASSSGKGLSSKLIRPFLKMADSQKIITYTDTVTKSNVPLYEHFGFQCVEKSPVAGTGITVYALLRPIH